MAEQVVLVDKGNKPIGFADKSSVHNNNTPLHRGFSLFLFNPKGQLLLQQRAKSKKTWPGVWSNSVCGHPGRGESAKAAAVRRAKHELGIILPDNSISVIIADYHYRYELGGVVEHEICPVLVAVCSQEPLPNPKEVADVAWMDWREFLAKISLPNSYSPWCQEEAILLSNSEEFKNFYKKLQQT